jgi:hypothetical protein
MPIKRQMTRIALLLILASGILMAATSFLNHYIGHRVYLRNSTLCRVAVMQEHDGIVARPGETVLVKSGLVDRTPTLMITAKSTIWASGLHFSFNRLQIREHGDIIVPASWSTGSLFGATVTYAITRQGQLVLLPPGDTSQATLAQPAGLPIQLWSGSASKECGIE